MKKNIRIADGCPCQKDCCDNPDIIPAEKSCICDDMKCYCDWHFWLVCDNCEEMCDCGR